jgi:hypothetical protein
VARTNGGGAPACGWKHHSFLIFFRTFLYQDKKVQKKVMMMKFDLADEAGDCKTKFFLLLPSGVSESDGMRGERDSA